MRFLIDIAIVIVVAAVVGLATAWYALDRGHLFGAVRAGEWTAWPRAGGPSADPYSLAVLARTGELPLGDGEGIAFTAENDKNGQPLDGRCDYLVSGQTPAARLWTLTAYDRDGRLMANPARRPSFHSREILRRPDGGFAIAIAAQVQPGNWLPIGAVDRFKLVLRLYDTPLTTGSQIADLAMPQIAKAGCR